MLSGLTSARVFHTMRIRSISRIPNVTYRSYPAEFVFHCRALSLSTFLSKARLRIAISFIYLKVTIEPNHQPSLTTKDQRCERRKTNSYISTSALGRSAAWSVVHSVGRSVGRSVGELLSGSDSAPFLPSLRHSVRLLHSARLLHSVGFPEPFGRVLARVEGSVT